MIIVLDVDFASYHQYKPQEYQQDQGMHFQLGTLCSFQIFLPRNTFQLGMELVGY